MKSHVLIAAVLVVASVQNARATCTVTGTTVKVADCGCVGDGVADDTACWQDALNAARDASTALFGAVEATQGKVYKITDTLTVTNTMGGVIDGNGAMLRWAGPNDIDHPMWLLTDNQKLTIQHLYVSSRAGAQSALYTAFEFTHGPAPYGNVAPSGNKLEHVVIDGTDANGLNFGIRFSNRNNVDFNNDLSVISHTGIWNVMIAAVSIEHSQSKYHMLRDVVAISAIGAECSSFVSVHTPRSPHDTACAPIYTGSGSFEVDQYSGGGFTSADYELTGGANDNVLIVHSASEGSNRMIRAEGVTGGGQVVQVIGGRFAVNGLSAYDSTHCDAQQVCDSPDGSWIRFTRAGPLVIDGIMLDGTAPNNVTPKIHFNSPDILPYIGETLDVRNVQFAYPDSTATDPIDVASAPNARVNASGNLCTAPDGGRRTCPGYAGGISGWTGLTFDKLDARPDGHQTYCNDCAADTTTGACTDGGSGTFARRVGGVWKCDGAEVMLAGTQTLSNKTLDSSNTFPNTLLTTTGTQTLSNKTLTDSTNVFPGLGMLAFTNSNAISTTKSRFLGPNTGVAVPTTNNDATTDVTVAVPFPALTARQFLCRASAAPGASKSWTMTLIVNGSATGASCVISGTATPSTCSQTLSASVAAGGTVSVKIQPSASAPASATVLCSLRTAN